MPSLSQFTNYITDVNTRRAFQEIGDSFATASIPSLTDNSGGTANDTIAVITAPTALTHAVGTADNTVADVGAAFNQGTLNDNFKELTTAQAANRAAIVAVTDAVADLAAKVNAILAALR